MFISARHRLEIYFQEIYYGKFRYLINQLCGDIYSHFKH